MVDDDELLYLENRKTSTNSFFNNLNFIYPVLKAKLLRLEHNFLNAGDPVGISSTTSENEGYSRVCLGEERHLRSPIS